jgi:hypothetical protein
LVELEYGALHILEYLHKVGPSRVTLQVGHLLGLGLEAVALHHGIKSLHGYI